MDSCSIQDQSDTMAFIVLSFHGLSQVIKKVLELEINLSISEKLNVSG